MLKRLLLSVFFILPLQLCAQTENHGANISWTAPTVAASCTATSTPSCSFSYTVLEGATGAETNVLKSGITTVSYTDDGPTLNAYLGTTRCYVIQFIEITGAITETSNSKESCATWPASPDSPGAPAIIIH